MTSWSSWVTLNDSTWCCYLCLLKKREVRDFVSLHHWVKKLVCRRRNQKRLTLLFCESQIDKSVNRVSDSTCDFVAYDLVKTNQNVWSGRINQSQCSIPEPIKQTVSIVIGLFVRFRLGLRQSILHWIMSDGFISGIEKWNVLILYDSDLPYVLLRLWQDSDSNSVAIVGLFDLFISLFISFYQNFNSFSPSYKQQGTRKASWQAKNLNCYERNTRLRNLVYTTVRENYCVSHLTVSWTKRSSRLFKTEILHTNYLTPLYVSDENFEVHQVTIWWFGLFLSAFCLHLCWCCMEKGCVYHSGQFKHFVVMHILFESFISRQLVIVQRQKVVELRKLEMREPW